MHRLEYIYTLYTRLVLSVIGISQQHIWLLKVRRHVPNIQTTYTIRQIIQENQDTTLECTEMYAYTPPSFYQLQIPINKQFFPFPFISHACTPTLFCLLSAAASCADILSCILRQWAMTASRTVMGLALTARRSLCPAPDSKSLWRARNGSVMLKWP